MQHLRFKMLLREPLQYGAAETGLPFGKDGASIRYIRITDITKDGRLRSEDPQFLTSAMAARYMLENGDILLARSGATVGKAFMYQGPTKEACFAGYLIRAQVDESIASGRFVYYTLLSNEYWSYVDSHHSLSTIQNLNAELYGNFPVPMLPREQQDRVAGFLDEEMREADALVSKYERLNTILQEKRAALITHVVTKGLDAAATRKDSGVDWLGHLPSHWRTAPLKYLVKMSSGSTPDKGNPEYWQDGRTPWASAKDLKVDDLYDTEDHITELALSSGVSVIPKECILTVVRGMILARYLPVVINRCPMAINQDLKALQPNDDIRVEYLAHVMRSISSAILARADVAGHGTRVLRSEVWTRFKIPVPPLTEQDAIVAAIRQEDAALAALSAHANRAIALSNERRSNLISAAVTGQIDVSSYKSNRLEDVA